jgi:hypothetical protein
MTDDIQLTMTLQQQPLALVFDDLDGCMTKTVPMDAETGLFMAINLLYSPMVFERIKMPRLLKHLIIWALTQSCPKIPEIRI